MYMDVWNGVACCFISSTRLKNSFERETSHHAVASPAIIGYWLAQSSRRSRGPALPPGRSVVISLSSVLCVSVLVLRECVGLLKVVGFGV